jgi:DNA-binding MarR family transcriptional regulator
MELDKLKGHSRLKMSFSQVISHISPHGSLINDLAKINGVSKQAISQVVKEVEDLGYIERKQNPRDARSTQLFLTEYGLQLIADSVANISVLRTQLVDVLGEHPLLEFSSHIEKLYDYFSSASAQLLDESQRLRIENSLRHLLEALYRDDLAIDQQKLLFSRSGNRARLSTTALEILTRLEIKIAK